MTWLKTWRFWLGCSISLLCLWLAFRGVFQLVGQQALVLPFGAKYDAANALAITLTAHLVYYLLTTALGVIGLWRLGESFMNLGRVIAVGHPARKTPLGEVVP